MATLEAFAFHLLDQTFGEQAMPDFDDTPNTGNPSTPSTGAGSNDLSPTPLAGALATPENPAPTDLVEETKAVNDQLSAEAERKATPGPVENEYEPSPASAGLTVATHDRDSVQPPAPATQYAPEAKRKGEK